MRTPEQEPEQKITHEMAWNGDAGLRQKYLDNLDLGEMRPYFKRLEYDPSLRVVSRFAPKTIMQIRKNIGAILGIPGFRSVVQVGPSAFAMDERDFLSTLLKHEGQHARDIKERPRKIFRPSWQYIFEKPIVDEKPPEEAVIHENRIYTLSERRADHAQLMAHQSGEMPLSDREHQRTISHRDRLRAEAKSIRERRSSLQKTSRLKTFIIYPFQNIMRMIRESF